MTDKLSIPEPSREDLILEFAELVVIRHGGSVLGHQYDIISVLECYPLIDSVSLLKAIVEDLNKPENKGTSYWVLLTERVKEELEKQGLSILEQ